MILATRVFPGEPLFVSANRDEDLARPAIPPFLWTDRVPALVAPRDLQAGGTWLGVNASGLFVGITNRWSAEPRPDRRSRGFVVLDALGERSVAAAVDRIAGTDPSLYNPFHLVVADRESAALVRNDEHGLRVEPLSPGVHVVTERSHGAAPTRRVDVVRELTASWNSTRSPTTEEVLSVLRHRAEAPLEGPCVCLPDRAYGTRSSTIVRLTDDIDSWSMHHAEGPPCASPLRDTSALLRALVTPPFSL